MTQEELLNTINNNSNDIEFDDVIDTINRYYSYTPTRFVNGIGNDIVINEAGVNEGSCKIFAYARIVGLTKQQTLACFAQYYRDVLSDPGGDNHANIRCFNRHGWKGIHFDSDALKQH